MKRLNTTLLGAIALSITGTAHAQSALNISGTISPSCSVLTLASAPVNLNSISDPSSPGALNAAAVNVLLRTTPSITCNGGGTTLSIDAAPLLGPSLPAAASSLFSNVVNYTATINKSGSGAFVQNLAATGIENSTTNAGATSSTVGLISSSFSIALSNALASGVLVAGDYNGTVTIALTPG
jgi:hypothetical protein